MSEISSFTKRISESPSISDLPRSTKSDLIISFLFSSKSLETILI